jgi:two-component system, NarL family, invasion response regulator UvrY
MAGNLVSRGNPDRRSRHGKGTLAVLIVDSHMVTRHGVKQLLTEEFRGVTFGEATTKGEALEALEKRTWQAVILEINIPGNRGVRILEEILRRQPEARVLVLTVHPAWQYASKALSSGALAYLTKDSPRVELVKAFSQVLTGKRQVGRSQESLPDVIRGNEMSHEILSPQEFKVMLALAAGKRPGEIAFELKVSIKTVSTHKRRILNKMRLNNSADLVRYAIDHQLF